MTASEQELHQVNFIALEFTNQKNGVWGELIGLGRSGHPTWCPVYTILSRVRHLRSHNAPLTTPLYAYYDRTWKQIDTAALTTRLCTTVSVLGAHYGIKPSDISVRSLHAFGAMALLSAQVDTDVIRLLGHWHSDEMLQYLHVQSFPLITPLALQMLGQGTYTLIPNNALNG
jgi:hypothetical protein